MTDLYSAITGHPMPGLSIEDLRRQTGWYTEQLDASRLWEVGIDGLDPRDIDSSTFVLLKAKRGKGKEDCDLIFYEGPAYEPRRTAA